MTCEEIDSEIEEGDVICEDECAVVFVGEVEDVGAVVAGGCSSCAGEPCQLVVYVEIDRCVGILPLSNWKKEASSSSY